MIIINPGSENKGGTLEQATEIAKTWLQSIHDEGFKEVEMCFVEQVEEGGNFLFHFTHPVTKKVATLSTHGFTDEECKQFMFHPRVYWNGSSTGNPKIEDWLAEGFDFRIQYYKS